MPPQDKFTVMFGAVIFLDSDELSRADGHLLQAVQNRVGMTGVQVSIAEVVGKPKTLTTRTTMEDTP